MTEIFHIMVCPICYNTLKYRILKKDRQLIICKKCKTKIDINIKYMIQTK